MLLCGLLMSEKVLATEAVLQEMSGGKLTYKEMPDDSSLLQRLERELADEMEIARNLSLRSVKLCIEYREVFLFDDRPKILEILTSPEHPYKINMIQLSQSKLRISELEQQIEAIQFPDAKYLFYIVKFSFLKPNPQRWGIHAQSTIDQR